MNEIKPAGAVSDITKDPSLTVIYDKDGVIVTSLPHWSVQSIKANLYSLPISIVAGEPGIVKKSHDRRGNIPP